MGASTWESWDDVADLIDKDGGTVEINKADLPPPREAGAARSVGLPKGQDLDWRFPPRPDGSGLHVQEFSDHYSAHIDRVHPTVSVLNHLAADAPKLHTALMVGSAAWLAWRAAKLARKAKATR